MATYAQRAQAHADATLNRAATVAEINRLARGLAHRAGRLEEYEALGTNALRAEFYVKRLREIQVNAVAQLEGKQAGSTAEQQASATATSDLAEAP